MPSKAADALRKQLPDDFSRSLLDGSLRVLRDGENAVRLNLFCAGLREVYSYVLQERATDADIRATPWFPPMREARKRAEPHLTDAQLDRPTRTARMMFATQGGLSDAAMKEMNIDVAAEHAELKSFYDDLSAHTHIRPDRLISEQKEIDAVAAAAIGSLSTFLQAIDDARTAIAEAIIDALGAAAFEELTKETVDDLDILSTHTYVEATLVEEAKVTKITPTRLFYELAGHVILTLNYGSGSDFVA
jgi:hypothetical protein